MKSVEQRVTKYWRKRRSRSSSGENDVRFVKYSSLSELGKFHGNGDQISTPLTPYISLCQYLSPVGPSFVTFYLNVGSRRDCRFRLEI